MARTGTGDPPPECTCLLNMWAEPYPDFDDGKPVVHWAVYLADHTCPLHGVKASPRQADE